MNAAANRPTRSNALTQGELERIDAYWRAANYLSAAQIYLLDNPLLREPLKPEHIKPRLLGHWGTAPGLNLIYAHLNRVINARDLNVIYIMGPGHGGAAMFANSYLEGSYSELYSHVPQNEEGVRVLLREFSFPGGVPSHAAPEAPGSIHEGGELGYALAHAFGAAFDNPDLVVACVVGDGEAETGPLATAWHSNKFLNPATDGAVLPILHLNGYKIASATVLARIPRDELEMLMRGYGYRPYFVEGSDPARMHQAMADTLDAVLDEIADIQRKARAGGAVERPQWPMIVLKTPKGWTGPKHVGGRKNEDSWRSHQVPFAALREKPEHLALLEEWLRSYRPDELFDAQGRLVEHVAALAPKGGRRLGANPHANGGLLLRDLRMPDFRRYAVHVPSPGAVDAAATAVMGEMLRDVMSLNEDARNFRVVGPDETASNRLHALFEATGRTWLAAREDDDEFEVVASHSQALAQCRRYLDEHYPSVGLEAVASTARGVQRARDDAAAGDRVGTLERGPGHADGVVQQHRWPGHHPGPQRVHRRAGQEQEPR
jgi:xylulose-5-phosphate/fructose-6-phosphate phosphoketolase